MHEAKQKHEVQVMELKELVGREAYRRYHAEQKTTDCHLPEISTRPWEELPAEQK